jgi:hypothetical protein
MKVTGSVSNIELDSIEFVDLKNTESRCNETLELFEDGEDIVIIATGKFNNNKIVIADNAVYFVKFPAAQDFLTRFVDSLTKKIDKPDENT